MFLFKIIRLERVAQRCMLARFDGWLKKRESRAMPRSFVAFCKFVIIASCSCISRTKLHRNCRLYRPHNYYLLNKLMFLFVAAINLSHVLK